MPNTTMKIRQMLHDLRRKHRPRAVRFWRSPTDRHHSSTLQMFTQDIHMMTMLRSGRSEREIRIDLTGSDEGKEGALLLLSSIGRHEHYHEHETIADSVETIAQYLATFGRIVFEVLRDEDGEAALLSAFTPESVCNIGLGWLQWIPAREREHTEESKRFLFFQRSTVLAISIPTSMGGYSEHRRLLKQLARFDSIGPRFLQTDLESGKWPAGIEIGDYHRKKRSFDYSLTNRWGWNGRDLSLDYVTEFYRVWRWLRLQLAIATLREHIVQQLNEFFGNEGIDASIILAGTPARSEIDSCRSRLLRGEIGFKDVYELLRP